MRNGKSLLIAKGLGVVAALISLAFLTLVANVSFVDALFLSLVLAALYTLMTLFVVRVVRKRHPNGDYETQAENLYALVDCQVQEVLSFHDEIKNHEMATLLSLICEDVRVLLKKVAEKQPNSRKSAATTVGLHLQYITADILPQYIEMQNAPRFFPDSAQKLKKALEAFAHLEEYLRGSITLLEEGDNSRFEVALKLIDPLDRSVLF